MENPFFTNWRGLLEGASRSDPQLSFPNVVSRSTRYGVILNYKSFQLEYYNEGVGKKKHVRDLCERAYEEYDKLRRGDIQRPKPLGEKELEIKEYIERGSSSGNDAGMPSLLPTSRHQVSKSKKERLSQHTDNPNRVFVLFTAATKYKNAPPKDKDSNLYQILVGKGLQIHGFCHRSSSVHPFLSGGLQVGEIAVHAETTV